MASMSGPPVTIRTRRRRRPVAFALLVISCTAPHSQGFLPPQQKTRLQSSGDRRSKLCAASNDEWAALLNKVSATSSTNVYTQASAAANIGSAELSTPPSGGGTFEFGSLSWPTFEFSLPELPNLDGFQVPTGDAFAVDQLVRTVEAALADAAQMFESFPVWGQIGVTVLPMVVLLTVTFLNIALMVPDDFRKDMEPYPRGTYDPIQARAFYSRHPLLVIQRTSQVFRLSNRFILDLLFDKYILRDEEINRAKRADELLELVTKLGPTAIKVGQALSVRPDLIPREYATALTTLQDQVPPFPAEQAAEILRKELGPERFSHLKKFAFNKKEGEPVASASIGQVYRGFLDSQEVAVKVQRPNVLAEIALDLHLVREFAPTYAKITNTATDLQGLADEWGRGFIGELNYRTEAANTIRFNEEMQQRSLTSVIAPPVVEKYSTEQVLTTEWIDGVRLDQADEDDVPRLCAVALNAYLVMLLELQSLHCDPHPGNLLRTKDGRLCILDFGMTLDIDPALQYSLLEYVAHLTSNDYDKLPEDFVALGFLKEERLDFVKRSGVLEPLKYFLKQIRSGGGARGVRERIFSEYREKYPGLTDDDLRVEMRAEMKAQVQDIAQKEGAVTGITMEVEELQRRNRDSFQIPEWFLYTSRAFLTLEGISLQADEDFSIIKSCFPYVAKRLLADDSSRAEQALRDLLYGAGNQINPKRVSDLADGFTTYTTTSKSTNKKAKAELIVNGADGSDIVLSTLDGDRSSLKDRKEKLQETEATVTLAKDSADILLNPNGNLVQRLLVEEGVLATSARVKDNIRTAFVEGPQKLRESLPFGVGTFLPRLPFEDRLLPFLRKTPEEEQAQRLAETLLSMVPQQSQQVHDIASGESRTSRALTATLESYEPEQVALLAKELRENLPKYAPLVGALGGKYASALLQTASNNAESTLASLEMEGKSADVLTRTAARGFSKAAKTSANLISDRVEATRTARDTSQR